MPYYQFLAAMQICSQVIEYEDEYEAQYVFS